MTKKQAHSLDEYVVPLYVNKLHGRMLRIPPKGNKKREILIVYGHHSSIERMYGIAEDLSQYGGITLPDLPGFGGMDSFYKIGEKPTLDNLADYLASLIKLRFKRGKITIVGMSFGFIVATRMLQKYPDLSKKIDLIISVVGFTHRDDLKFKKRNYLLMRYGASIFSNATTAWLAKNLVLKGPIIRMTYLQVADKHSKLKDADSAEQRRRINFEIKLWKINDIRTYMDTTVTMFTLDLCDKQIDLVVHNIQVANDRYLDNEIVEQHMKIIFKNFKNSKSRMKAHAPTVIADAQASAPLIPKKIRSLLK